MKYKSKNVHFELRKNKKIKSIKKWILSVSSNKDCVKVFGNHLSEYHFVAGSEV